MLELRSKKKTLELKGFNFILGGWKTLFLKSEENQRAQVPCMFGSVCFMVNQYSLLVVNQLLHGHFVFGSSIYTGADVSGALFQFLLFFFSSWNKFLYNTLQNAPHLCLLFALFSKKELQKEINCIGDHGTGLWRKRPLFFI